MPKIKFETVQTAEQEHKMDPNPTAVLMQFIQLQAEERREERRQSEERFAQLLQTMQGLHAGNTVNAGNAAAVTTHAAHAAPNVQPQILRPPSNIKLLSETPNMAEFATWRKSWEDYYQPCRSAWPRNAVSAIENTHVSRIPGHIRRVDPRCCCNT
jgi:hypothetical protein